MRPPEKLKREPCVIDCHTHVGADYGAYTGSCFPYCMSFEDLVVRMELLGVDYSVVFPFSGSSYHRMNDAGRIEVREDISSFPYEMENQMLLREIHEVFPEYAECAMPFAMFDPSRKTEEQVALFGKLHEEYGLFGLKTCSTYIQAFIKDLEDVGRPILDFAQEHQLPLTLHSSYMESDPWASVYDIIQFAENHPEVRICIAHVARFTKEVIDRASDLEHCFVDLSAFAIHCQLAREGHAAIPPAEKRLNLGYGNPIEAMAGVCEMYPDTIIWGTDTPFYYWIQEFIDADGVCHKLSLKSSFELEVELLTSLPNDMKDKIAWQNAVRFLFGAQGV